MAYNEPDAAMRGFDAALVLFLFLKADNAFEDDVSWDQLRRVHCAAIRDQSPLQDKPESWMWCHVALRSPIVGMAL